MTLCVAIRLDDAVLLAADRLGTRNGIRDDYHEKLFAGGNWRAATAGDVMICQTFGRVLGRHADARELIEGFHKALQEFGINRRDAEGWYSFEGLMVDTRDLSIWRADQSLGVWKVPEGKDFAAIGKGEEYALGYWAGQRCRPIDRLDAELSVKHLMKSASEDLSSVGGGFTMNWIERD